MRGHHAFSLQADTHLSASQGGPKVATRMTASTALGRDHTPAWQSLLTGREATVQVPHITCSLLPSNRGVGPTMAAQCLAVASSSKQAGTRERARQQDRLEHGHEGAQASMSLPCPWGGPQP